MMGDYDDAMTDMHRWMIPLVGFFYICVFALTAGLMATKGARSFRIPKAILIIHVLAQLICSVFLLVTVRWDYGVQLALTSIFGLFAGITLAVDYLGAYAVVCLFNLLSLLGKLKFLGYGVSLYQIYDHAHPIQCQTYFGLVDDPSRLCFGYVSFTRVLAYLLVWIVAGQIFFAYYIYKERSLAYGSVTGSATTKTREEYGALPSEDFGIPRAHSHTLTTYRLLESNNSKPWLIS